MFDYKVHEDGTVTEYVDTIYNGWEYNGEYDSLEEYERMVDEREYDYAS